MRARCGLFLMIDVALVHPPAHTYRGRRRCVWGGRVTGLVRLTAPAGAFPRFWLKSLTFDGQLIEFVIRFDSQ